MISAFGVDHGGEVSKGGDPAVIAARRANAMKLGMLARYVKGEPRKRDYILAGAVGGGLGGLAGGTAAYATLKRKKRQR